MSAEVGRGERDLYELFDAYLDGELTPAERSSVDELLDGSPAARAELADIDRVRSLVRGLPAVDAPFGFYERIIVAPPALIARSSRRTPGVVVASVGAMAAAILLFVAVTPTFERFTVPISDMNERHVSLAASMSEAHQPAMSEDQVTDSLNEQGSGGDFRRVDVVTTPGDVQMLYTDGESMISVFEQTGRVEWSDLPVGGSQMMLEDDPAWAMAMPTTDVVVVEREGMVVTVIGTAPHDVVMATAEAVPDPPPPSLADRFGDACEWMANGFGFPD